MSTAPVPPGTSLRLCEVIGCGRPEFKEYPTHLIPDSDRSQYLGDVHKLGARLCMEHVRKWRYDRCNVTGCDTEGIWYIQLDPVPYRLRPALFGLKPYPESYYEWERYPDYVFVCQEHRRELSTKHGRVLAFRKQRDGTTTVRVKEELF